jgi:uncharacterized protein
MPTLPSHNPFVYGRILAVDDAACPRPDLERSILQAASGRGRVALVGDRRLGKSTLVERTLAAAHRPVLAWNFQKVMSLDDLLRRAAEDFDAFVRQFSPVARKMVPWLREIGVGIEQIRLRYQVVETGLTLRAPTDHLKRLLGYVAQLAQKRAFCFFIDELQDVQDCLPPKEADAVLGILRAEIQKLRSPCFFAGSAQASFRALFLSETSPFFESAQLMEVGPIPPGDFTEFLQGQFRPRGKELSDDVAALILSLGGDSPNDVQHLAHEIWNGQAEGNIGPEEVNAALSKIMVDVASTGETWLDQSTPRQLRALLSAVFLEQVGASTGEFLALAGIRNTGQIESVFRPFVAGRSPIVEKLGSRYRVRSRFLRLWFAMQRDLVRELIPALRGSADYDAALRKITPILPRDAGAGRE